MIVHKVILKEGGLEIFRKVETNTGVMLGYGWVDLKIGPNYPNGFGCFPALCDAMEHYAIAARQYKQGVRSAFIPKIVVATDTPDCALIKVDFKLKKRVG